MGAPKQKWNSDEEAALKAGVIKHGPGKWRTILKDPQFSGVLYLRSNVDLKDKWRNMSVMANGWGSRERARFSSLTRMHPASNPGESSVSLSTVSQSEEEMVDVRAHIASGGSSPDNGAKGSITRLDNLIVEAINNLREPGGSSKVTIAAYIKDQYWAPPNFKRILSGKLKHMSSMGKLIKVRRRYTISPLSTLTETRRNSSISVLEARRRISARIGLDDLEREKIDLEQVRLSSMTPEEAAAVAAQAVAEAEEAMAAAEEALREAEAAEAEAEAAEAFAEAALKTWKRRNTPNLMCHA